MALLDYYTEACLSVGTAVRFFQLELPGEDSVHAIFTALLTHQRWQAGVFWALKR